VSSRLGSLVLVATSGCWLFAPLGDVDGGGDAGVDADAGADVASPEAGCVTPGSFCGCYADMATAVRDLPHLAIQSDGGPNPPVTVEACIAACAGNGCAYGGLQDGRQCYCGNSYGMYGSSTACELVCAADKSETCGGPSANDVYRTTVDAGACN
jgi:hypothetical protein